MEKDEILDTSIAIERNSGTITVFTLIEYPTSINKFDIIFPETNDYITSFLISNRLREAGKPIGAIDIMISAMCLNRKYKLLTKDKDFNIVKENFPEFNLKIKS